MNSTQALALIGRANELVAHGDASKEQLESTITELTDVLTLAVEAITIIMYLSTSDVSDSDNDSLIGYSDE